jgi:hypothetical protein
MAFTILLILAGLMGAGGVVLAAAGAHAAPHAGLAGAAYLLLFDPIRRSLAAPRSRSRACCGSRWSSPR